MQERDGSSDDLISPNGAPSAEALEQRVCRLEDAVSTLQDTRQLEERVVQRVSSRLQGDPSQAIQNSAGVLVDAGRKLLPAALDLMQSSAGNAEHKPAALPGPLRRPWVLLEAWAEARAMVRMYFDPRYRPSWWARTLPLLLLAAIATSWIWLPGTSMMSSVPLGAALMTLIDKAVDLILAFVAFKILSREVRRYHEVIADIPLVPRS
jgi:hypothetical protein